MSKIQILNEASSSIDIGAGEVKLYDIPIKTKGTVELTFDFSWCEIGKDTLALSMEPARVKPEIKMLENKIKPINDKYIKNLKAVIDKASRLGFVEIIDAIDENVKNLKRDYYMTIYKLVKSLGYEEE